MTSPPFTPTHVVPQGGLPAWNTPDPARAPVANVDAGLEVQIVERVGDWASVTFSNGWTAWVDGSLLQDLGASTGGVAKPEAARISFSPALIGGLLVALSTILPWVRLGQDSVNAFKVPIKFLFDPSTQSTGGGFSVGLLLVALGAVAAAGSLWPRFSQVQRAAAGGCLLIVSVCAGQLQRAASELSQAFGQRVSLFSLLGLGVFVCLAGSIGAVLFKGKLGAKA